MWDVMTDADRSASYPRWCCWSVLDPLKRWSHGFRTMWSAGCWSKIQSSNTIDSSPTTHTLWIAWLMPRRRLTRLPNLLEGADSGHAPILLGFSISGPSVLPCGPFPRTRKQNLAWCLPWRALPRPIQVELTCQQETFPNPQYRARMWILQARTFPWTLVCTTIALIFLPWIHCRRTGGVTSYPSRFIVTLSPEVVVEYLDPAFRTQ
jgi:hypothetical protein